MKRLATNDSAFLYAERFNMPMHVGALHLYRPPEGASADWLHQQLAKTASKLTVYPFNQKLAWPLSKGGLPHWQECKDVDLEYHVRHYAVPKPGRFREMFSLVSSLHGTQLHRDRPLWEAHIIEGIDDNRFAIYYKIHHALVDGMSAMKMLQNALSGNPDECDTPASRAVPRPKRSKADKKSSTLAHGVIGNISENVQTQLGAIPGVFSALKKYYQGVRVDGKGAMIAPFQAPPSMLNQKISASRRFVAQSFDLPRLKKLSKAYGATINDIVLAMTASALRRYLLEHNSLPDKPLTSMVPVSVRPADSDDYGNAVSMILVSLATDMFDPVKRLKAIQASISEGKSLISSMTEAEIFSYTSLLSLPVGLPMLLGLSGGNVNPPFNVVISNVPGPNKKLYWNGAALEGNYPVSIITNGAALNITVISYVDKMEFGLVACRRTVPGVQRMIEYLEEALIELEYACT